MAWLRLTARGRAGHGSITNTQNSIGILSSAVARLSEHRWPLRLTKISSEMSESLERLGAPGILGDPLSLEGTVLAPVAGMLTSSVRHVANPTVRAGKSLRRHRPHGASDGRLTPAA